MLIAETRLYQTFLVALMLTLAATMVVSLGVGRYPISPATVIRILGGIASGGDSTASSAAWTETQYVVVDAVRLPRVLAATAAGVGLGVSGAALQGLFRNPLVGPQVIGISNGAAFGGVFALLLGWPSAAVVASAFAAGLASLGAVFGLNRHSRGGILAIVLAGVIVSSFFAALVGAVQYVADPERQLPGIVYWLLGSFASVTPASAVIVGLPTIIGTTFLMLLRWRINLLSLDEVDARALGVPVARLRWLILTIVTLIVAAQVAVSGSIGWVGLVVPHLGRGLVGPDHRRLLPASALMGGIYLLLMDGVARTISAQEIPLGILTALIGTPIFAVMFWRTQSAGWSRA